jgi:hypothetical protein
VKPTLDKLRAGSSIMYVDNEQQEDGAQAVPEPAAGEVWQDATDKLELALKHQLLQDMATQSAWQLEAYAAQLSDGDDEGEAAAASTHEEGVEFALCNVYSSHHYATSMHCSAALT